MSLSDCDGNSTIGTPCTCLQIDGSLPVCQTNEYCPHNWGNQPLSLGCLPTLYRKPGDSTPLECSTTEVATDDCVCPTLEGVVSCHAGQWCDQTTGLGQCSDHGPLPACPTDVTVPEQCVCTPGNNCDAGMWCIPQGAPGVPSQKCWWPTE